MPALDVLIAHLGDRRIGLPASVVRHVVRAASITPLPAAPAIVEGVLNVHGSLLPVLDLRCRFGMPPEPLHTDQHFIIAEAGPRRVVLRVDRALDVARIDGRSLEPATEVVPGVHHAAALARMPDGVIVIHDLERFLSLDEERALDEAVEEAVADLDADGG